MIPLRCFTSEVFSRLDVLLTHSVLVQSEIFSYQDITECHVSSNAVRRKEESIALIYLGLLSMRRI